MPKPKSRPRNKHNPIVLQPDTNIGNSSAEADDEFLFDCFVDHPSVSTLQDMKSSKLFASGRTGSGKTAIIRMIDRQNEKCSQIELSELALEYVANSDIIQFLNALNVDLDLFYQALWKHVFCLEYIRLRFSIDSEKSSVSLFGKFRDHFSGDPRRKQAIAYLKEWESRFWITMDENIKEITQKIEEGIDAELAVEVEKFKARAGYARQLSIEKRSALIARAKKVVNSELLSDLSRVMDLLSDYSDGDKYKSKFYILIDKLDEKWVDDKIRYDLIRALIECLKSFRKIHDLKVIVAIRSDVVERVIQESAHSSFQREKFDDYFLRIRWSKEQLKNLVEKRINFLFRIKYSSENAHFDDVFEKKVGGNDAFDYMIERTLLRPRDIISFVNVCLVQSQGRNEVNQAAIRQAEAEYSRIRLQALIQEWQSAFPSISLAFRLLAGRHAKFEPGELTTSELIEEFILEVSEKSEWWHDPIYQAVIDYMKIGNTLDILVIWRKIFAILYRIGAVGIKVYAYESYAFSYKDVPVISESLISNETKMMINPMLHRALNISTSRRSGGG